MSHEAAAIAKQPLFEVAEGVRNDGAASDHHLWMGLHSLLHTLKRRFMDMLRERQWLKNALRSSYPYVRESAVL
ncbi:hypothetical protein PstZobell_18630 [Stutzerimonas stutzeri ATCC 14405 = CCUG 16156]|nr:hypothetical protein PstZobell_18630 [Stutzerimonas stutzeri ATCC 14405 = CCUG 16156]